MAELFVWALLGHLVGDYLLQTKTMALRKSERGADGLWQCTLHCLVYAAGVTLPLVLAMRLFDGRAVLLFLTVLAPHWIVDRWSLASHWLKLIGGRTFEAAFGNHTPTREFDIAFTCLVYAVTDNTLHLICLWVTVLCFGIGR